MSEKVKKQVADSITEEPTHIEISRDPRNAFERVVYGQWLPKIGFEPLKKTIRLTQLSFGTLHRISSKIMDLDIQPLKDSKYNDWTFQTINANARTIASILAAAIHNKKSRVPESLIDFVLDSLTMKEVENLMEKLIGGLDLTAFINTITSTRSLDLLSLNEVSPADTRETIALGESLAEQSNTST